MNQFDHKRIRLDAVGGLPQAFGKKFVTHQPRKQVNNKRVFGMHAVAQVGEHNHHDQYHGKRFEHSPHQPEIVTGIPYLEIAQGEVEEQAAGFNNFIYKIDHVF